MKPIKTKDFSVSQESFTLEYDSEFHLYKTTPIPDDLGRYYESDAYISHTDAKESLIDKLYQKVKKITLSQKAKLLSSVTNIKNANVLDIGCGTGSFLEYLNDKNWNTVGIEPNQTAKEKAVEKGVTCFSETNELESQKFDIITMWHVLEHVPDFNKQF